MLQTGRGAEAVPHLEVLVRQNPENGEFLLSLGNALIMAGEMRRAASYPEKALAYLPDDVDTRNKAAQLRASLVEAERALSDLNEHIQQDPDNPVIHIEIARIHHSMGDLEEARIHYRKALSLDSNSVPALEGLSAIYASEQNFARALENLTKINELNPDRADIPYNIACMYARQERIDDSLQWLNIAVNKGYNRWGLIKSDPDLDNIRGTEAYRQLVQSN